MALQYCLVLEYLTHLEYPPWIHHWMLTGTLPILHESMQHIYTAKTLELLKHIFRLSQLQKWKSVTKECYQRGFLESSVRSFFFLVTLAGIFLQKIYLATFLPQACKQGTLQREIRKIKETTNFTRNADL